MRSVNELAMLPRARARQANPDGRGHWFKSTEMLSVGLGSERDLGGERDRGQREPHRLEHAFREQADRLVHGTLLGARMGPSRFRVDRAEQRGPGGACPQDVSKADLIRALELGRAAGICRSRRSTVCRLSTSVSCLMSCASRGRAASAFMARRCSGEAAKTRRPGWSNTRDADGSPLGAA